MASGDTSHCALRAVFLSASNYKCWHYVFQKWRRTGTPKSFQFTTKGNLKMRQISVQKIFLPVLTYLLLSCLALTVSGATIAQDRPTTPTAQ
jgi:hypothetical protein